MHIFPSISLCWQSNLLHTLLRQSSHNTRPKKHQSDVDERGPSPKRHGEQEEARHRQHELGCNFTRTGATSTWASWKALPRVLASPRLRQRRPGAIWDTQAFASAPDTKWVYDIERCTSFHLILYVGDLTCSTPCFASRCTTPGSRSTNQTWTSEGQLHNAMERRRKCAIDNTSWAITTPPIWCHLNLSQRKGVAPSPGVHQTPSKAPRSDLRHAGRRQRPGQQMCV